MRPLAPLLFVVLGAEITIAAACSTFEAEPAPAADAATDDAPYTGDSRVESGDAPASDASADAGYVVLASGLKDLTGIAVANNVVYVCDRNDGGVISKVEIDGKGTLQPVLVGAGAPVGLTIMGGEVYWIDATASRLSVVQANGGNQGYVAPGKPPFAITSTVDRIVIAVTGSPSEIKQYTARINSGPAHNAASSVGDIAVQGNRVYFTDSTVGFIQGIDMPVSDGGPILVETGEEGASSIATDPLSTIYWARGDRIMQKTAGQSKKTIAVGQKTPFSLAADGQHVYWISDGRILRAERDQGDGVPPEVVASGFASAFGDAHVQALALTFSYVVWITSDGRVLRHDR